MLVAQSFSCCIMLVRTASPLMFLQGFQCSLRRSLVILVLLLVSSSSFLVSVSVDFVLIDALRLDPTVMVLFLGIAFT